MTSITKKSNGMSFIDLQITCTAPRFSIPDTQQKIDRCGYKITYFDVYNEGYLHKINIELLGPTNYLKECKNYLKNIFHTQSIKIEINSRKAEKISNVSVYYNLIRDFRYKPISDNWKYNHNLYSKKYKDGDGWTGPSNELVKMKKYLSVIMKNMKKQGFIQNYNIITENGGYV